MSTIQLPDPVKVIASLLSPDNDILAEVISRMSEEYGDIDYVSELLPFEYTDYYSAEMGERLARRFISFDALMDPGDLSQIKVFTNSIEAQRAEGGRRQVNIDPGYISEAHLILATGKRYTHRPYIGNGVYADLTLMYRNRTFQPLEWTYPDYAGDRIITMLIRMRTKYLLQLAEIKDGRRGIRTA
jgi:hypothetical protein